MTDYSNLTSEQLDYIDSFQEPAELDFASESQKQALSLESVKLQQSIQHFKAKFGEPKNWPDKVDKEIMSGQIYSVEQALSVADKLRALSWYGNRVNLSRSLVTPTGQRVIMSAKCADKLGFKSDNYVLESEIDQLTNILSEESIEPSAIANVRTAAAQYGLVILQNGSYIALRSFLENSHGIKPKDLPSPEFNSGSAPIQKTEPKPSFDEKLAATRTAHGQDLAALVKRMEDNRVNFSGGTKTQTPPAPSVKMTPEEIKKETSTPELPNYQAPRPAASPIPATKPVEATPAAAPSRPQYVAPKLKPRAELNSLSDIRTVEDLSRISIDNLREAPMKVQIEMIKTKIVELAQINRILPYYAVVAFEQSPLFQTYLSEGSARVIGANGEMQLRKNEFEAIADLRNEIERL